MAAPSGVAVSACLLIIIALSFDLASTQVLTPPYFNLAVSRNIEATSTCGEGVTERELFCKLTGANPGKSTNQNALTGDFEVIQGQLCDYCDANEAAKVHPAEYAIDGTERWWQSPPLSRGLHFNEVNLTVNLGQTFHVAYVFIKMGNSPRPGVFVLERSTDDGATWKPWQYFADTKSDCNSFFGLDNYEDRITSDDSVICTTEYSKVVPLEGGEIVVSLVNNRPSANNFSYSQTLQDWTKATNLRLRLLRTKTLLGHLMAVARQDPTITRRYYYSIKDISIGGRCVCNGHASVCDKTDPFDQYKLLCRCQHNTCGDQCQSCCPGFVQKPWQPATLSDRNECEPCQCYGHTDECIYDEGVAANFTSIDIHGNYEGGGVCQNCRDNTMGVNCEKCRPGYFHPYGVLLNATDACQECECDPFFSTGECDGGSGECYCKPEFTGRSCEECAIGFFDWPRCRPCECNVNGTQNQVCQVGGGECPCKPNYEGTNCDQCAYGYYGFPDCKRCDCDSVGSLSGYCEPTTGQCTCRTNYGDRDCGACGRGHYNYPSCDLCTCDPVGSTEEICDMDNGYCLCKDGFGGPQCSTCAAGFYNHPHCQECGCAEPGSQSSSCDESGQCVCNYNYAGKLCESCAPGYYKYPECLACNCDPYGAYGSSCDQEFGQCDCRPTFEGLMCEKCKANFYNYPICEECNCNPAGAKQVPGYPLGGCGASDDGRLCECKDRVSGRICDTCLAGYWNLNPNNPFGCEDCACYTPGTVGTSHVCDVNQGQCFCKPYVSGRSCDTCVDGTYNLMEYSPFGCIDCKCDPGGSVDTNCDKDSGQCTCRPRVNGRTCSSPLNMHFFPNLYHLMYEFEDGRTKEGGRVRYGFDNNVFYGFSWRGYAIFSRLQHEVLVDVDISKPSLYRLIFRYVNPTDYRIMADVSLIPGAATDVQQDSQVVFEPSMDPQFVTVSGGGLVSDFVLNPGRWSISLNTAEELYVDYVVLLPQDYYEASILQDVVNNPCQVPVSDELCKHFIYVDLSVHASSPGEQGYIRIGSERNRTQLFDDDVINEQLGNVKMAHIDANQPSMMLNLPVDNPGQYVLVIVYHSGQVSQIDMLDIEVASHGGRENGQLKLPGCPYSALCRQVVTDQEGMLSVFNIDGPYASLTFTAKNDANMAIESVIAIPYDEWNLGLIQPQLKCLRQNQECLPSSFYNPTGSIQVEAESGPNEDLISSDVPPTIDASVKVIKMDPELPAVTLRATVSNPGRYVIVAHYYQPYSNAFDVNVEILVDGVVREGTLRVEYCPNDSGCRAVLKFDDTPDTQVIEINNLEFILSMNNTRLNPLWLDYIILVSADSFSSKMLDVQGVDKSGEFIAKCGYDDFYIDHSTSGFCRDAVYSLTTFYNNGALQCNCNPDGSVSFSCEEFGGQCRCRPNIIGRTCSECQTGYFGFPDCRPCNCPSGLCDPQSGQCVCPPRVTGENCDSCLPRTFGYDPFIGCEECGCSPFGVQQGIMDCNVDDGQCSCKPNVAGRRCDQCEAGHYSYPGCYPCSCDPSGSLPMICDQDTSECLCRENVEGSQCDQCKASTFYLEERNPEGCTKCFCFNLADRCESSTLRLDQITEMQGWGITNLASPDPFLIDTTVEARINNPEDDILNQNIPIYWIAPSSYLGNKITSYGAKLAYTVTFRLPRDGDYKSLINPDVRIEGNNFTLAWISPEQPIEGIPMSVKLDMLETSFVHERTGAAVTRQQFMMVLQNIDALQIRGSFYTQVIQVQLADVSLDFGSPDGRGEVAHNVEQCACPPNYQGTSCEECVEGYYRSRTGPYLGVCVPCQCNNKADKCDPETGECINCRDNYSGPECLTCMKGHYEDPYTRSCQMCSCPLPVASNNFASTCQVAGDGSMVQCLCEEGYSGRQCELCDIGYYGNPAELGGRCQPCSCNDNIDLRDPFSCDVVTGECLRCINNSTGTRCELCADWFFGDAVYAKDCQTCDCDHTGADGCDKSNGVCLCKPNVVGARCDQCAPQTFGFESAIGCERCDCGIGAHHGDCDLYTGQCDCRPGVIGRKCDQCEPGHWNYGSSGCATCNCEFEGATTCNVDTGKCQCLPGVTGDKCDQCLDRWALIPEQGCIECDNCIHLLLDDMEFIDVNVTSMIDELESVSVGQGAIRRLEEFNSTVDQLRPYVDEMIRDPTDPSILDPLKDQLMITTRRANDVRNKADRMVRQAQLGEDDAITLKLMANELNPMADESNVIAEDAVAFAKEVLQEILSNIDDKNVGELLRQAELILNGLNARNFYNAQVKSEEELEKAMQVLKEAEALQQRAYEQTNHTESLSVDLSVVLDKLNDLMNSSRHSLDNAHAGADLVENSRELLNEIKSLIALISNAGEKTQMCFSESQSLLNNSFQFLQDAELAFQEMEQESSQLDQVMVDLKTHADNLSDENYDLEPLVDKATAHAHKLREQAELLESMIADTKMSAEGALNASQAYQAIVDAINKALNASQEAITAAEEAMSLSNGLADKAQSSQKLSETFLQDATDTANKVDQELQPRLDNATAKTDHVANLNQQASKGMQDILIDLDSLPEGGYSQRAQEAVDKAIAAQTRAVAARDRVQDITEQLPGDKMRVEQIPRMIEEANMNVRNSQGSVDSVIALLPQATTLLDSLSVQAEKVNLVGQQLIGNISALRDQIQLARDQSNLIEVGMTFSKESSLQVRNPVNLQQAASYSKLSMYIKTQVPSGLLAYIGPDGYSSQQNDDYMKLEVTNGLVVFRYDLGDGPGVITNPKNVSDGKWHQVIAERTGKTAFVTVRTADEDDVTQEGESPGTFSVLDLDANTVKFYVGGVPDSAGLGGLLEHQHFIGAIESVDFGGVPIGLWNFAHGANNNGCVARDELTGVTAKGFRFDGSGYVILEKHRFIPGRSSLVRMRFKTFNPNGLLFLMGNHTDYYSIELRNGKVLFQFDLGSGPAFLESSSNRSFNDGQWHQLLVNRQYKDGLLKVDEIVEANGRSSGQMKELSTQDLMYLGGYKGTHGYPDVTQQGFEGCITEVQLGSATRDINNDNVEARGVLPGCPEMARVISFDPSVANSYLALESINIDQNFQMTMKIKTETRDGLLFYTADETPDQLNSFSVSLVEGKIVVIAVSEGKRTVLETHTSTYDDGAWHYITVTKVSREIQVDVDDFEMVKTRMEGKRRIKTTIPLYLGGVPNAQGLVVENVGSQEHFKGCIGDVTINGRFLNFAQMSADNMAGVEVNGCPIVAPEVTTHAYTLPPPQLVDSSSPPDATPIQCTLPKVPAISDADSSVVGARYGSQVGSRIEYDTAPESINLRSDFSIELRTTASDGVIFYTADERQIDFFGLYMKNGQLVYAFNCGSGTARIVSDKTYNDGLWHKVVFSRDQNSGQIVINDGEETKTAEAPGSSTTVNVVSPYFVGGLDTEIAEDAASNLQNVVGGFIGCLRGLMLNSLDMGAPSREVAISPCTNDVEEGTFFYSGGGFLTLKETFSVGLDLEVYMEVRPRSASGVLLSVYGTSGDYLVLQLVNGEVVFSVDNGQGEIKTTFSPRSIGDLCDGQWHTIKAVKAKNVVTLTVDSVPTYPGIGPAGVSETNTQDALYLGGLPEYHRGVKTQDEYVGCVRDVKIGSVWQNLNTAQTSGKVALNTCPAN